MKDLLYPLRSFHGKLHDKRIRQQLERERISAFRGITKQRAVILGTPLHKNVGDSAIVLAEAWFLQACGLSRDEITEISRNDCSKYEEVIMKALRANPNCLVCWLGGGNMGDQWMEEERFRREALMQLSGHPMVIFPQTVFYTDTATGRAEAAASVPCYNQIKGLTIVAREDTSFRLLHTLYPDTASLLTPDIVLSASMEQFGAVPAERSGVLMCLRSDPEKSVDDGVWEQLEAELGRLGLAHRRTDMYAARPVTKENRVEIVREKMQEFCGAELVITDRLHGMVFAAITGTPCIVFSNYNHKVRGTYEWIRYLPYIRYVESVKEAESCLPELLAMKNCSFDNTPLLPYFEKLKEVVRSKCPKSV